MATFFCSMEKMSENFLAKTEDEKVSFQCFVQYLFKKLRDQCQKLSRIRHFTFSPAVFQGFCGYQVRIFLSFFGKLGEIVGMTMLKLFYHNFLKNQLEKQYTQIISRQTELFNKIYVSNFLVEIENGSSKYDQKSQLLLTHEWPESRQ